MSEWEDRMQHLIDSAGDGVLRSECIVDQVYAKYQELRDDLVLHGGGQHHYTRDALYGQVETIMRAWADRLVTPDGSDIRSAAGANAERISAGVFTRAPFEFGDLRASGHPRGLDKGAVIYDRPPAVGRLSEEDLRAKGDLHRLGLGNRRGGDLADALTEVS